MSVKVKRIAHLGICVRSIEKSLKLRDAYGKWCELITESERYGIPDVNLYNYYIKHRDYCNSMM